jgi:hypothetical protein
VGRPFADWLHRLINSGEPTSGIASLAVILAVAILALAATLLASAFRCRRPLWAALASAGLFAQPYGLANLSFQFDAPLMATAVLLALAEAWQGFRQPGLRWRGLLVLPIRRLSAYVCDHAAVDAPDQRQQGGGHPLEGLECYRCWLLDGSVCCC